LRSLFGDEPAGHGVGLVREDVEDSFQGSEADDRPAVRSEGGELGSIN
jgi:hypothetical protein